MARIALVTGGTRGIGAAIALALKEAGFKVAANYASNVEAAEKFSKDNKIPVFKWDVADYESCSNGVERVEKELGGTVEVLVNNAGITRDAPLHKMSPEQWGTVVQTNLTSCFNMSRVVIDTMRAKKFGRIVNISSVNGQLGQFGQSNYAAAKAGMMGFSKSLARETATKGITVNIVAPGYTDTEMVRAVKPEILDGIVKGIPTQRLCSAEEIARAVVFLSGDEAGYITGETLNVNGGIYMP